MYHGSKSNLAGKPRPMWVLLTAGPALTPFRMEDGGEDRRPQKRGSSILRLWMPVSIRVYKGRAAGDARVLSDYFIANSMKSN